MKVKQYITHGLLSIPNDWFQAYLDLTKNKNALPAGIEATTFR